MAHDKRRRANLRALCGELHNDDGVDPGRYFRSERNRDQSGRKAQQLCRQVQRTLDLVFSGETRDALLATLRIVEVTSRADSSALLVTVAADLPPAQFDAAEIQSRLERMSGWLRSEVAVAITRKRTPLLVFRVLGPSGAPPAPSGNSTLPGEGPR